MSFIKNIFSAIYSATLGKGTDVSKSGEKGFRGALTLVAAVLISNIDSITQSVLKLIPDQIESISISGQGFETITVQAVIAFALVGIANVLKRSPWTADNKLVRMITG